MNSNTSIQQRLQAYIGRKLSKVPSAVMGRAISIYNRSNIDFEYFDAENLIGEIYVESESHKDHYYSINFDFDFEGNQHMLLCDCPYFFDNHICKHSLAFLLHLKLNFKGLVALPGKDSIYLEDLSDEQIGNYYNLNTTQAPRWVKDRQLTLEKSDDGKLTVKLGLKSNTEYQIDIEQKKKKAETKISCTCNNPRCQHEYAALLMLRENYGVHALQHFQNWNDEKAQLLKESGLTPELFDKNYEWIIEKGELNISLKKGAYPLVSGVTDFSDLFQKDEKDTKALDNLLNQKVGFLFTVKTSHSDKPMLSIGTLLVKLGKNQRVLKTGIDYLQDPWADKWFQKLAGDEEKTICTQLQTLPEINLHKQSILHLTPHYEQLKSLIKTMVDRPLFYNSYTGYGFHYDPSKGRKEAFELGAAELSLHVTCTPHDGCIKITTAFYLDEEEVPGHRPNMANDLESTLALCCVHGRYYAWRSLEDMHLARILQYQPVIMVGPGIWPEYYEKTLRPFMHKVNIDVQTDQITIQKMQAPASVQFRVVLSEMGQFLLIYPVMLYGEAEVNVLENGDRAIHNNMVIQRHPEREKEFLEIISGSHPDFSASTPQDFFYIHIDRVMEKFWFLKFYELCQQKQIEVFGLNKLKKIQYSPITPNLSYRVSSGTDWFDIKIEVDFDGHIIPLKALRKAIINQNNLVQLGDGKVGILPEEWLKKISAALRFGKIDEDGVKLKKSQFMLIDMLYQEYLDEQTINELSERKQLLNENSSIKKINPPKMVKANLRHYQEDGLNWLVFLDKLGLGGCLADDMGLGKTLQLISLIAHKKQTLKKKYRCSLVVCPTTLLFNWEKEIQKFAPQLKYLVHWGTNREQHHEITTDVDVLLTTYGTLTNDIEHLRKIHFDLVILDESQAIKNPTSLRYKAVNILNSDNRFVMTGTPIENNTTELFSQMQFINPGLLGNLTSFQQEFAGQIDNHRNADKIEELKRLVSPFILRRTKEKVAQELPAKTELVHYCEMNGEQRKVYDSFKHDIRQRILKTMEEEGMAKSRFMILESLTKMRQICDSPALLNTQEGYGNDSVKADELMRMLREKMGKHKALVFSQFLGMLDIIEQRLNDEGIKYVKLTGQTRNRQQVVEAFENDDDCRVFLISLKAGGTGLNLVSADYVFLVDPWWNPAVENQAIDRTHRIGQTKKVFAYRMICKDTVEEKILALQEKKKALSDDIIGSDSGFVSKLTSEDIKELFA